MAIHKLSSTKPAPANPAESFAATQRRAFYKTIADYHSITEEQKDDWGDENVETFRRVAIAEARTLSDVIHKLHVLAGEMVGEFTGRGGLDDIQIICVMKTLLELERMEFEAQIGDAS